MERGEIRRTPIAERACTVGDVIGVNAYRAKRALLRQRLNEGGYRLEETEHFLVGRREQVPKILIAHWFAPTEVDADIGYYFMQELKPLGLLRRPQHYGEVFAAIVSSLSPREPLRALRLYAFNTLARYQHLLDTGEEHALTGSPIATFSALYRRVCALQSGGRFLDAGCSFGFLPLLLARRFPTLRQIIGLDIQADSFALVRALAQEQGLSAVRFEQLDLLDEEIRRSGPFDTITLLHVLEHFCEEDGRRVLRNLLAMSSRRLLIAVPYEEGEPEAAYGHEQLFTRSKLEELGVWCLQQWNGQGRIWCEECEGGLLIVERAGDTG